MKEVSFYEFVGIVAPGALVLVGASYLIPGLERFHAVPDIQLGGLGVFTVLAYVSGHLTQSVGNAVESVYWGRWGGMPTAWIRRGKILSPMQYERLARLLESKVGAPSPRDIDEGSWFSVTREVYAAVSQAKRAERVDIFNGNYGLNRGIAAAGCILFAASLWRDRSAWQVLLAIGVGVAIAVYRMHRFGVHYAHELFVQYLDLRSAPENSLAVSKQ